MNCLKGRLGERLVEDGYITEEELKASLEIQRLKGGRLGSILINLDFITEEILYEYTKKVEDKPLGKILLEKGFIEEHQLNEALETKQNIKRFMDRRPIGEILLEKGLIHKEELDRALAFQSQSGGFLGEILLSLGIISPDILYRELATQSEMGRIGREIKYDIAIRLPYEVSKKYGVVLINEIGKNYVLAVTRKLKIKEVDEIESYLDKPIEEVLAFHEEIDTYINEIYEQDFLYESVDKIAHEDPSNSAKRTMSMRQTMAIAAVFVLMIIGLSFKYTETITIINAVVQVLYFCVIVFKTDILLKGAEEESQIHITEEEISEIDERKLPIYTILVPLYKEIKVFDKLIKNLDNLDYPKHKLDIRLLLEEDDTEVVAYAKSLDLPSYYTIIVVPDRQPKTKPKACNYGLIRARGKYSVIYDAEDQPDPDQLKKVYLAFEKLSDEYICIQGKLNYYNSKQNLLTKLFTHEYSMWFEMLLPGLMRKSMPIPLGGTSNHFKTEFLKEVNAWDPYNVTEDADLGIRLFKKGYKTVIVNSRTWEEANSRVWNWIRQRSRWIKGYMQTWLIHMRHPIRLYEELGWTGFWGFQIMVLGTPLLPIINPYYWLLTILWFLYKPGWIPALFPGIIYYMALSMLVLGNFYFVYSNAMGIYHIIEQFDEEKEKKFNYDLVKYTLFTPFYWVLMSIAAYKALWQLIFNPHYWEKTEHGLDEEENTLAEEESHA